MRIEAASDPASGSVIATEQTGGSGAASRGSQRCFCSSVPSASSGPAKKLPCVITQVIGLSPQASSSSTRQTPVKLSMPPPPYCAGRS